MLDSRCAAAMIQPDTMTTTAPVISPPRQPLATEPLATGAALEFPARCCCCVAQTLLVGADRQPTRPRCAPRKSHRCRGHRGAAAEVRRDLLSRCIQQMQSLAAAVWTEAPRSGWLRRRPGAAEGPRRLASSALEMARQQDGPASTVFVDTPLCCLICLRIIARAVTCDVEAEVACNARPSRAAGARPISRSYFVPQSGWRWAWS